MHPILYALYLAFDFLSFALLLWIIFSWLISFRILNVSQPLVYHINHALSRVFEPMLKPIRKYMPNTGAIDLAPLALFFIFKIAQYTLAYYGNRMAA